MITVSAPAKINLTLEVLGKRADGYHEIRSVIQTISLADALSFHITDRFEFRSDSAGWDGSSSLVSRAATLLAAAAGTGKRASITVTKHIPLMSGLGGDSSDAAATLLGLNDLWELRLNRRELEPLASRLGSDVAFFLQRGTAMLSGRGETVTPLPPLPKTWIVLASPRVERPPGKTGQLYQRLLPAHFTGGEITRRFAESLESGGEVDGSLLFNTFENVAFAAYAGLDTVRDHLLKMGAPYVHLAGSGPALFAAFGNRDAAEALFTGLRTQNLDPFLAETVPA